MKVVRGPPVEKHCSKVITLVTGYISKFKPVYHLV